MDHDPGLGDLLQARVPLQDDERSVPVAREQRRCPRNLGGNLVRGAMLGGEEPGERPDAADPLEGAPQLGLEDHHEREEADHGARLEDLGEEPEVERLGREVDDEEDAHADHEANGPGSADEAEEPIDQDRGDPDVDSVAGRT